MAAARFAVGERFLSFRRASDPLSFGTNVICNHTVTGNLTVHNSAAAAPWNLGLCGENTIDGNLVFDHNAATTNAITGNTIGKNLACTGNGDVTAANNNVGRGATGQCVGLKT